ncbi:MAG: hypothetical protein Q7V62_02905, partial [Actinomycetota bacterium]|nr:hypothetical protein [Actinomycetota bacterium]
MLSASGGTAGTTVNEAIAHTYYTSADVQLTGRVKAGDVWTVTLDGLDYSYTVLAADATAETATTGAGLANIASGLVTKITSRSTTDTNDVTTGATYTAALSAPGSKIIRLSDANGFWFALNHKLDDAAVVLREGSVQGNNTLALTSADIVFSGTVAVGDIWTVTLNGNDYSFTAATTSLDDVATGLDTAIGSPAGVTVTHTGGTNTLNIDATAGNTFTVKVKESGATADGVAKITNVVTRAAYQLADVALTGSSFVAGDSWTLSVKDQDSVSKTFTATGFASAAAVAADLVAKVNAATGVTYAATQFGNVVRLADAASGKYFTVSLGRTGAGNGVATVNGTAVQSDTTAVKWANATLALTGTYKASETYTVTVTGGPTGQYTKTATYVAGTAGTMSTTGTITAYTSDLDGVAKALDDILSNIGTTGRTYTASSSGSTLTIADPNGVTVSYSVSGTSAGTNADASTWTKSLAFGDTVTTGNVYTV